MIFTEDYLQNIIRKMENIPKFKQNIVNEWPILCFIIKCCWLWNSDYRISTQNILQYFDWYNKSKSCLKPHYNQIDNEQQIEIKISEAEQNNNNGILNFNEIKIQRQNLQK